jgi:hypothetical protein
MTRACLPLLGPQRGWNRQRGRLLDRLSGRHYGYLSNRRLRRSLHGLLVGYHRGHDHQRRRPDR